MERNEAVCSWQKRFPSRLSCWKCHQLQRQAAGGRTRSVDSNEKRRIPNNNERRLHRRSLRGRRAGCLFGCHQTHADELCHLLVSTEDSLHPDFWHIKQKNCVCRRNRSSDTKYLPVCFDFVWQLQEGKAHFTLKVLRSFMSVKVPQRGSKSPAFKTLRKSKYKSLSIKM